MVNEYIDNLLARHFSGEASPQDKMELEQWIAKSKENENYFEEITFVFQSVANIEEYPQVDTNAAFNKFKAHIGQDTEQFDKQKSTKHRIIKPVWQVLAAAAALVAVFLIFGTQFKNKQTYLEALNNTNNYTLPNGVKIILYKGGTIKYANNFKNNLVELEGKACFYVNSNKTGSIKVKTGNTFIEDIGTIFIVDAILKDSISVVVEEGKVRFYTKEQEGILLEEGTSGFYLDKESVFKQNIVLSETMKTASFIFNAIELEEAISQINAAYASKVILRNKKLAKMQISVNFSDEDIDTVLEVISETLNINLEKEGDTYTLSK